MLQVREKEHGNRAPCKRYLGDILSLIDLPRRPATRTTFASSVKQCRDRQVICLAGKTLHRCICLRSYIERLRGLLFREVAEVERLFYPCNSVHTFFMTKNLDIAFIDYSGRVIATYRNVPP